MNRAFADTGYYVAYYSPRDAHHAVARTVGDSYTGRFVTTEFILIEVANFFLKVDARPVYLAMIRDLRADRRTTIVPATSEWVARGHDLFAARPDHEWSLTDCISFAVMTEQRLTAAFSADRHFAQAGFVPLLA